MKPLHHYVHLRNMERIADKKKEELLAHVNAGPTGDGEEQDDTSCEPLYAAVNAVSAYRSALEMWKSLSKKQRDTAVSQFDTAMAYMMSIVNAAKDYSGETKRRVSFEAFEGAASFITNGERYSSRCRYRKQDAMHVVSLSVDSFLSIEPLLGKMPEGIWILGCYGRGCRYAKVIRGRVVLFQGGFVFDKDMQKVFVDDTYEAANKKRNQAKSK